MEVAEGKTEIGHPQVDTKTVNRAWGLGSLAMVVVVSRAVGIASWYLGMLTSSR